jgi:hypothetical protein
LAVAGTSAGTGSGKGVWGPWGTGRRRGWLGFGFRLGFGLGFRGLGRRRGRERRHFGLFGDAFYDLRRLFLRLRLWLGLRFRLGNRLRLRLWFRLGFLGTGGGLVAASGGTAQRIV